MLVAQNVRLAAADGTSEVKVDSARTSMRRLFDVIRSDTDSATAASQLRSILKHQGATGKALDAQVEANTMPWFRDFARSDPSSRLEKITLPTLALFGTNDLFVPPARHAKIMRAALATRSSDATVRILDGLNHWMQPSETGRPREIAEIETTIAPQVLSALTSWIRAQVASDQ